jgi:hypothetical protein
MTICASFDEKTSKNKLALMGHLWGSSWPTAVFVLSKTIHPGFCQSSSP